LNENILNKVWPEWKVTRVLGRGSYGIVYEAERRDSMIGTKAAIKVISVPQDNAEIDSLRSEGMTEENAKSYFQQVVDDFIGEIRIMESFKGVQNIVSVEDYKVIEKKNGIGWDIYIRMELLTPFNAYLTTHQMSEQDIIRLGIDMCTALELCAKRNVIHRDIKPENIFVNSFGDFKLGDFGIARRLENVSGGLSMKGTFFYMAPEVERGIPYDARVDIYSLGLVLYRLANNNRLPFLYTEQQIANPNERQEAVRRRLSGEPLPPPSGVSGILGQIILCACSFDPANRFGSATAMKNALLAARNQAAAPGTPPPVYIGGSGPYAGMPSQKNNLAGAGKPPKKSGGLLVPIIAVAIAAALIIAAAIIVIPRIIGDDGSKKESVAVQIENTEVTEPTAQTETTTVMPETTTAAETATTQTKAANGSVQISTQQTTAAPETTTQPHEIEIGTGSNAATPAANAEDYAQETKYGSADMTINIPDLQPGDVVQLGNYEQDNNFSNGAEPVEWVVLSESEDEEGVYLLISKYGLDAKPYDNTGNCSSWDNCSLRTWMNGDFYNSLFSSAEKKIISKSGVTNDHVFPLRYDPSGDAGVTYFMQSASARSCYATAYAIANGAWVTKDNGHSPWWLRNMVDGTNNAYMVKSTGEIGDNVVTNGASSADIADHTLVTVRPCIWIKQP